MPEDDPQTAPTVFAEAVSAEQASADLATSAEQATSAGQRPRIGIVVVAYNAESTLAATLDRIPHEFRPRITEVIICDDASHDDTFSQGKRWGERADSPRTLMVRHTKNLGYGGNQKAAYRAGHRARARHRGAAARRRPVRARAPAGHGRADRARRGGRRVRLADDGQGERQAWRDAVLQAGRQPRPHQGRERHARQLDLTEFHSGYRAYSTSALGDVPFEANTDAFDFDTQVIVQLLHAGKRIVEIPIPTYYGDEICYVNGMQYAKDVVKDVLEYRLSVMGFGTSQWVPSPNEYAFKEGDGSSHTLLLTMLEQIPPTTVLDIGCSAGLVAEQARAMGHTVVGVDFYEHPGVRDRTDDFFKADLEEGIPKEVGEGFGVVIIGDVIEHLTQPRRALDQIKQLLAPDGQVLLSVPNFGHWYPRTRVALGRFGYDRRGILDDTHLRFFTRASLLRLVRQAGFDVLEQDATGLPLGTISPTEGRGMSAVRSVDRALVKARPTLFGYQHILRLTPHAQEELRIEIDEGDSGGAAAS